MRSGIAQGHRSKSEEAIRRCLAVISMLVATGGGGMDAGRTRRIDTPSLKTTQIGALNSANGGSQGLFMKQTWRVRSSCMHVAGAF